MSKRSDSNDDFFRRHPLGKSSLIRGIAAFMLSAGTGMSVIYLNYHNYWKVTIYRTQTVDFNMLSNLLPTKLSTHLLKNDIKGLQEVLDTNYGLFGILVTDCKSDAVDCPQQQIIYGSKVKIENISNIKQRLVSQDDYASVWTKKFALTDTPSQLLKGSDYVLLRNPPPIKPEWTFANPRDNQIVVSQYKNINEIIGRVYLVRGNPPSFLSELKKLFSNPLTKSSRNIVYDAIAGSAILTGILAWLLSEIFHYQSRKADRLRLEANLEKIKYSQLEIEFEREIRQAAERVTQANIEKFKSEEDARLAQAEAAATAQRLDIVTQEKLEAENKARLAQAEAAATAQRLDTVTQEKLEAENKAHLAQAEAAVTARRLDVATQEKLKSEEDARLAQVEAAATARRLDATDKQRLEAQRNADFAQAEAAATARRLDVATQSKIEAENKAHLAQAEAAATARRLDVATQEKLKSEEDACLAQVEAAATARRLDATDKQRLEAQRNADFAQAEAAATARRLDVATQSKIEAERNAQYLYDSIKAQDIRNEQLIQDNPELQLQISELKRKNTELQLQISGLERLASDDNAITENTSIQCDTVCNALIIAGENFAILNIWDKAYDSASNINHYLPRRIYTVLEILAEVGSTHFQGSISNSISELLNQKGVRCSGESTSTMNKYGLERVFHHRGESRQMEMHIKVGRYLRIYFDIDTENQKIIIGYCGKHLRTVTG